MLGSIVEFFTQIVTGSAIKKSFPVTGKKYFRTKVINPLTVKTLNIVSRRKRDL